MYVDRTVRANGLTLHYTDWGDASKSAVLCVGGVIQECHVWDDLAARLENEYRIVCLDLRGQGDSDWTRDGYALSDFLTDIYHFARRLDLLPFHFVGHSLGARLGIAYGGRFPSDLATLVLSDFGPGIDRERALANRHSMQLYWERGVRGFRSEDEALAFFAEANPLHKPMFHRIYARHNVRLNWAGRLVPKADPDLFFLNTSAVAGDIPELWRLAAGISVPTLLARSTKEDIRHVSDEMANQMKGVIKEFIVEEFETGHYVPLEDPAGFADAVQRHLARA